MSSDITYRVCIAPDATMKPEEWAKIAHQAFCRDGKGYWESLEVDQKNAWINCAAAIITALVERSVNKGKMQTRAWVISYLDGKSFDSRTVSTEVALRAFLGELDGRKEVSHVKVYEREVYL